MQYKTVKAETLFYVKGNPQLNKDSFKFSQEGTYPYFTRTVLNNGILGYVDYLDEEHKIKGNSIAVGMLGMKFFYMSSDFYAGQFTKTIFPRFDFLNEKIALYFISLFNKNSNYYLSGLVRDFEKLFNETDLLLPVDNNGEINFKYMEEYISELEKERISELEKERISELNKYLKVTNLENYKLSEGDIQIVNKKVRYKDFKLVDVLDWQPQKEIDPLKINTLKIDNTKKYPFYGQATINNGIISYLNLTEKVLNNMNGKPTILIHSNNQNVVYLETPFYLKDGHGATSVLQSEALNEKRALYIMASIKKVITKKFSYNEKATKIALKNTYIKLPINEKDEIDYDYMEKYITIQEKLTIKNVIDWRDKQINATKQVVNNG